MIELVAKHLTKGEKVVYLSDSIHTYREIRKQVGREFEKYDAKSLMKVDFVLGKILRVIRIKEFLNGQSYIFLKAMRSVIIDYNPKIFAIDSKLLSQFIEDEKVVRKLVEISESIDCKVVANDTAGQPIYLSLDEALIFEKLK